MRDLVEEAVAAEDEIPSTRTLRTTLGMTMLGTSRQLIRPGLKSPWGRSFPSRGGQRGERRRLGLEDRHAGAHGFGARIKVAWPPAGPSAPRTIAWSASALAGKASQIRPPDQS